MELLNALYEHMIDADFELKALLMNIKVKNKELINERASKFCGKYLEINSCIIVSIVHSRRYQRSTNREWRGVFELERATQFRNSQERRSRLNLLQSAPYSPYPPLTLKW